MRTSNVKNEHAAVGTASQQHGLIVPAPNKALISPFGEASPLCCVKVGTHL
jgi:hypothetical protein